VGCTTRRDSWIAIASRPPLDMRILDVRTVYCVESPTPNVAEMREGAESEASSCPRRACPSRSRERAQQTIPPNLDGSTGKLRPSCVRPHVLHCPFFRQHLHSVNVRSPSVAFVLWLRSLFNLQAKSQGSGVEKKKQHDDGFFRL